MISRVFFSFFFIAITTGQENCLYYTTVTKERKDFFPNQLSGGQQQRVSIGRALYSHPAILLADEPTGNLDRKTGEEIVSLLKDSNRVNRQTLLLITHDENLAMQADRVIRIEDGRITKDERVRNLV